MQHTPNLALTPNAQQVSLDDLVATVQNGLLVTDGGASTDFQAKNGLLTGEMREIKNGRLGQIVVGGAVLFNSLDLWKKITTLGGPSTQSVVSAVEYDSYGIVQGKGEPPQSTSHSVSAVAAMITNQALINPDKKI